MAKIKISEQDIVNALCLHLAYQKQISPQEVEIELMYDDDYGFSAEAYWAGRKQILATVHMIEALRFWLDQEMNMDPFAAGIELVLDEEEGIIAFVR
ncbi:YxcD family protein [Bacillus sp. REN10]|uniref:YxcD family protein n=1 Tax=Bacillus sp. REN10 TaxID=2782541 RepID=UPI00193B9BD7|nr:YxcD family protein [Bacillus sp. REN10]